MTGDDEAKGDESAPKGAPEPPSGGPPPNPPPNNDQGPGAGGGPSDQQPPKPPAFFWQELNTNERLTAALAFVSAMIALLGLLNTCTNGDMKAAIGQLSNVAVAQQDQVNGIANETAAIDNEASAAINEAEQTAALVKPAQQTAKATLAEATVQEKTYILGERPTIAGADDDPRAKIEGPEAAGNTFGWNYYFMNYGNAVASNVTIYEYISVLGLPFRLTSTRHSDDLVPNIIRRSTIFCGCAITVPQGKVFNINVGEIKLVAVAIFTYYDPFGNFYRNEVCYEGHVNNSVGSCDVVGEARNLHIAPPPQAVMSLAELERADKKARKQP